MKGFNLQKGQRFGRWTVIDDNYMVKQTKRYVKCRCDCGVEQWVASTDLVRGRTKSCKHCVAISRRIVIPAGAKSKNWTTTGETTISRHNNLLYRVKCECGNTRWMTASEFHNTVIAVQCAKCAGIKRGKEAKLKNGVVGELDSTKYGKLKKTAESRHIDFLVSQQFLWDLYEHQDRKCAITGDSIPDISKASLDRIDSSLSYTEDNVQWVSKQANLSKHIMSMNELFEFCKKVLNHANQQPSTPLTKCEGSETNS